MLRAFICSLQPVKIRLSCNVVVVVGGGKVCVISLCQYETSWNIHGKIAAAAAVLVGWLINKKAINEGREGMVIFHYVCRLFGARQKI